MLAINKAGYKKPLSRLFDGISTGFCKEDMEICGTVSWCQKHPVYFDKKVAAYKK